MFWLPGATALLSYMCRNYCITFLFLFARFWIHLGYLGPNRSVEPNSSFSKKFLSCAASRGQLLVLVQEKSVLKRKNVKKVAICFQLSIVFSFPVTLKTHISHLLSAQEDKIVITVLIVVPFGEEIHPRLSTFTHFWEMSIIL